MVMGVDEPRHHGKLRSARYLGIGMGLEKIFQGTNFNDQACFDQNCGIGVNYGGIGLGKTFQHMRPTNQRFRHTSHPSKPASGVATTIF